MFFTLQLFFDKLKMAQKNVQMFFASVYRAAMIHVWLDALCGVSVYPKFPFAPRSREVVLLVCCLSFDVGVQVFKRAGRQFSKREFSVQCSTIKKALTTVISTFYQHFDDYIVMVTCLTAACSFALQ